MKVSHHFHATAARWNGRGLQPPPTGWLGEGGLLEACSRCYSRMPRGKLGVRFFPAYLWQPEGEVFQRDGDGDVA